jgi:hypothetical protein
MQDNGNSQPGSGVTRVLVPGVVIGLAVIFVLLHLTGVVGGGSH